MNSPDIKYENWFECLLLVRPKLLIVEHDDYFTVGAIDVRSLDNYDTFLKEMFEGTSVEKYGTDFLEQAVEYWLEERDKIVAELKDAERDNPKSINLATEILYYDRAIKISIDKYLKNANRNREKDKRVLHKDLPKPVVNWIPHFGVDALSRFCEDLTPEVTDSYVTKCFQGDSKGVQVAPKKKAKPKGKGGRPKDPKIKKKRDELYNRYYHLTVNEGLTKRHAIKKLTQEFSWKKTTIEKYIK